MMIKNELRKKYAGIRDLLPESKRAECSVKICEKVIAADDYKECDTVLCYAPIRSEADVWPVFDAALSQGKIVGLPRVSGDDMEFFCVSSRADLSSGTFGVLEPDPDKNRLIDPSKGRILMIVPGVAFDVTGGRIGYGKGYYDRYMSALGENVTTMAVCFEKQLAENIPVENGDIPVDKLVTMNGVIDCAEMRKESGNGCGE